MATDSDPASVPKLTEACIASLIAAPADPLKLYDLSTDELVALNTRLLTEHQDVKNELAQLKRNRYHVDPPVSQERVDSHMRNKATEIASAWEPVTAGEAECQVMSAITIMCFPRCSTRIEWDVTTGNASLQKNDKSSFLTDWSKLLAYQRVISSALLMYRLCCLFECQVEVEGPAGYKVFWSIYLKHKSSGHYVGFSEWKAKAHFRASQFPPTGTSFDEDWIELLNLLLDPRCPHPYDGTVAGSVA